MIIIVGSCSVFVFCFLLLLLLLFFFFQAWQSKTKSWLSLCSTRGDFSNCVYTNGDLEFCIVFSPMMRCSNLGRYLLYADMACFFFFSCCCFLFCFCFYLIQACRSKTKQWLSLHSPRGNLRVMCTPAAAWWSSYCPRWFFFLSSCLKPF